MDLPIVHHNKRGHRGDRFLREYRELTEAHQAHHCVACRKCEKLCPQNIRIADRMFEIKQLVSLAESIPN
ncbi:MAG: 4Fe-4S dicluster domain-containing protein [Eubacteriales bacterium]|nr:4Fe-4S dicluster domain-containing protein [Eubacteriales bacterium]